jgi:hypothetical protein
MNLLNEFFKQEKQRVFEPGPYFAARVLARLKAQPTAEMSLWESILSAARPVMAAALTLVLLLLGVHMFLPVEPSRGMIESYFASEVSPGESMIYNDSEAPSHDQLEQLVMENEL